MFFCDHMKAQAYAQRAPRMDCESLPEGSQGNVWSTIDASEDANVSSSLVQQHREWKRRARLVVKRKQKVVVEEEG